MIIVDGYNMYPHKKIGKLPDPNSERKPNQKEQLSQIRAISREVKEVRNDFHRKWGIRLSNKIVGFGSFI